MESIHFQEINSLREKRWSYNRIGVKLGISKQRVHQIYKGYKGLPWTKKRKRKETVEKLGGVCIICGSKENIMIHHLDNVNNNKLEALTLLCKKHHAEEHIFLYRKGQKGHFVSCAFCKVNKFWVTPSGLDLKRGKYCSRSCANRSKNGGKIHGKVYTYKAYHCRCILCKKAHNDYQKMYMRKRKILARH